MKKINQKRLAKIMAYDICAILDDAEQGDLSYLVSWLEGSGLRQYKEFDDKDVEVEWKEGEYGGPDKKRIVTESLTYSRHEYVRQLWNEGDRRGVFMSCGTFKGPKTPEFNQFGKRKGA
jgi:hypothetical protein